jgi:hypothetical protein
MTHRLDALVLDLVVWCASDARSYEDVISAWRTSCPRLTVWEEAHDRGLVETQPGPNGLIVALTPKGRALVAPRMSPPVDVEAPAIARPQGRTLSSLQAAGTAPAPRAQC